MGRVSAEIKLVILRHHPDEAYEPGRVFDFAHAFDWMAAATFTQNGEVEISGMVHTQRPTPRYSIKEALLEINDLRKINDHTISGDTTIHYHLDDDGMLTPQPYKLIRPR